MCIRIYTPVAQEVYTSERRVRGSMANLEPAERRPLIALMRLDGTLSARARAEAIVSGAARAEFL